MYMGTLLLWSTPSMQQHLHRSEQQVAPAESQHQHKPIYFPGSLRLHLRAHHKAQIEPLKPLFPDTKEGNQNRAIERKAVSQGRGIWSACGGVYLKWACFSRGNLLSALCLWEFLIWKTGYFYFSHCSFCTMRPKGCIWEMKRGEVQRAASPNSPWNCNCLSVINRATLLWNRTDYCREN